MELFQAPWELLTRAEFRFYKVVKSEKTRDIEDAIGKHIALEFRVVNAPSCLHSMSDLNLEYNVVTFNNTKRNGINWGKKGKDAHTRYRYVPGVGMQTVDRGYDGDTYVTRSCIFDNKSHIDMLDYTPSTTKGDSNSAYDTSKRKISESRASVILDVIERLNLKYGSYINNISLYRSEAKSRHTTLDSSYTPRLIQHFLGKQISIYNLTGDKNNQESIEKFVDIVSNRYGLDIHISKGPSLDQYNIPVILSKKDYKKLETVDQHTNRSYTLTQHIIINNLMDAIRSYESDVRKKATALENKRNKWLEEEEGRVIEDCPYMTQAPSNMTIFEVILEQLYIKEEIDRGKMGFFQWSKQEFKGDWQFAIPLTHSEDGKVRFDGCAMFSIASDGAMTEPKMFEYQCNPFTDTKVPFFQWGDLEYAIRDPSGNINVVRKTGVSTIPDAKGTLDLISHNQKTKRGPTVGLKEGDSKHRLFGGSIDIGYVEITPSRWIYHVGLLNMKMSIANSSAVREIEALGEGVVFFDKIFHMMSIPYVRHNQNTVMPLPIKYLREWCIKLGYLLPDVENSKESSQPNQ